MIDLTGVMTSVLSSLIADGIKGACRGALSTPGYSSPTDARPEFAGNDHTSEIEDAERRARAEAMSVEFVRKIAEGDGEEDLRNLIAKLKDSGRRRREEHNRLMADLHRITDDVEKWWHWDRIMRLEVQYEIGEAMLHEEFARRYGLHDMARYAELHRREIHEREEQQSMERRELFRRKHGTYP